MRSTYSRFGRAPLALTFDHGRSRTRLRRQRTNRRAFQTGGYAAFFSICVSCSVSIPGYHRTKVSRSWSLSTFVRTWSRLCAPDSFHLIWLRSGDIWVPGSRQFKDFEDYLLPTAAFEALLGSDSLPLVIQTVNLLA